MSEQPISLNIPSDPAATIRDMAARCANQAQEIAMLQGQIQTLLNLLTPDQIAALRGGNRTQRRAQSRAAKKAPAKKSSARKR